MDDELAPGGPRRRAMVGRAKAAGRVRGARVWTDPQRRTDRRPTRATSLPVLVVPFVVALALAACASRTGPAPLGLAPLRAIGAAVAGMPCASPLAVTTRDLRNPHDPAIIDQVVETVCPGVTVLNYRANSKPGPRLLPIRVVFTQADPRLPPALRVGAPVAALDAVLGAPKAMTASAWTYPMADDRADDELTVEQRDGAITRVTWSWGLD